MKLPGCKDERAKQHEAHLVCSRHAVQYSPLLFGPRTECDSCSIRENHAMALHWPKCHGRHIRILTSAYSVKVLHTFAMVAYFMEISTSPRGSRWRHCQSQSQRIKAYLVTAPIEMHADAGLSAGHYANAEHTRTLYHNSNGGLTWRSSARPDPVRAEK